MTRARPSTPRPGPAHAVPLGLKLGLKSTFVDLRAGKTPKARPVHSATAVANSSTRGLGETSSDSRRCQVLKTAMIRPVPQKRKQHAEETTGQRQDRTFRQQLPDETPSAAADTEANGGLPLPRGRARQQEVRDVGHRDHQHQARHTDQNQKGDAVQVAQLVIALSRRHQTGDAVHVAADCWRAQRTAGSCMNCWNTTSAAASA